MKLQFSWKKNQNSPLNKSNSKSKMFQTEPRPNPWLDTSPPYNLYTSGTHHGLTLNITGSRS